MEKISAVVITFNESRNIARCINSVKKVADEVLVIDSFSHDDTCPIAQSLGAKVIQRPWEGYSVTKNTGASLASYNWILSIDADEALSDELTQSILTLKNTTMQPASFRRLTNYCGRWIKHCGWYPDTKFRIFNRLYFAWEGLIHEQLRPIHKIPSKPIVLAGDCLHYSYYAVDEHRQQTIKFARLSAQDLYQSGKRVGFYKRTISPLVKFLQMYFLKLGILDGYYGLVICLISARAVMLKYRFLNELKQ